MERISNFDKSTSLSFLEYRSFYSRFTVGGIIWDADGCPVIAFGKKIDKINSVIEGELLAIKEGLKFAESRNFVPLKAYSDSLEAVWAVTKPWLCWHLG